MTGPQGMGPLIPGGGVPGSPGGGGAFGVTINQSPFQADPALTSPILFVVQFEEAVSGFSGSDVVLSGTAGATTASVSGAGSAFTVSVSGMTTSGTVIANIPAGVVTGLSGGTNEDSTSTDNTVNYLLFVEEACDTFSGDLSAYTQYQNGGWGTSTISGSSFFSIVSGKVGVAQITPCVANKAAATSARNAWASARNVGVTEGQACRIFINSGREGGSAATGKGSYYGVQWGISSGAGYLSIVKFANDTGSTIASVPYSVPVNAIVRIRHNGTGKLTVDVNGVDIVSGQDQVESQTGCWLRALGAGFAISSNSNSIRVELDDFCYGIVGAIEDLPTWNTADMFDTDTFASGLWIASGTGRPTIDAGFKRAYAMTESGSGTTTTWFGQLVHDSDLNQDQFIEMDMEADSSVKDTYPMLRSAGPTIGYYGRWESTSGGLWVIGKIGTGVLASTAGGSPGNHRIRFQAVGTALALYHWTGGTWLLKTATTDASITATGTVRIAMNDVFSQGIPYAHNVVIGNYITPAGPTVTIDQAAWQDDPTTAASIKFMVQFSEPVTGFATGDVTLSGTAGATTGVVTGSGATYIVTVGGMTSSGTVIATIAAGVATGVFTGITNVASTSTDNTVNFIKVALDTLDHWWDFSDIGTLTYSGGGTQVQQINDKIGTSHLPAPNNDPVVSTLGTLPAVESYAQSGNSANTNAIMRVDITDIAQPFTVAFVCGRRNTGFNPGGGTWLDLREGGSTPTWSMGYASFATPDYLFWRNLKAGPAELTLSGDPFPLYGHPYAVVLVLAGASSQLWINGALIESFISNSAISLLGITLFNTSDTSDGHDLIIGELQVGPGAHSDPEELSEQLFWKWLSDPDGPTVTINQGASQIDPSFLEEVVFDIVFSEPVTGFTISDINLSGTATGTLTKVLSGSGSTFSVTVSGMTGSGTIIAKIPPAVATSVATGNYNKSSTSTDNQITWNVPPWATLTGGTVTTSGGYEYHTFTADGTLVVVSPGKFEYCVVGAGGGGGGGQPSLCFGGGGAGGQVVTGTKTVTTNQSVVIGAGGINGPHAVFPAGAGVNGGNSSLGAIVATGGEGGDVDAAGAGGDSPPFSGANRTGLQGGGAAGAGAHGGSLNGGNGVEWPSASGQFYGGGGGGGRSSTPPGSGGAGGGGSGSTPGTNGGGGGGLSSPMGGSAGGNGIVIVRVAV